MKKVLLIITLMGIAILSGCNKNKDVDPVCTDDQNLVNGVCEDIVVTCDPGYVLEDNNCVLIDESTELERAFANSIGLENYQLDISLTEDATTINMKLEFDGNVSTITINDYTEYYKNENEVCTKISIQLGEIIEENIDCIAADDTRFKFFHGFEISWFEETEGGYALKEGNYALLTNFFRNAIPNATVSNFVLTVENDYFQSFTFNVTSDDTVYDFIMNFSNIDDVIIVLPE